MSRFRTRERARRSFDPRPDRIPLRAIVPNLVTAMAACAGITSISFSAAGRFESALWALLVAVVCDGMDGRIARLLNASSRLGAELDSLADFVNFGVAPAMFMFFWLTGKTFGADPSTVVGPVTVRLVLGCALFYALCDCFRLARFNTMLEQETQPYWKNYFTGVPAPGGCWMVLTPAILSLALEAKESAPLVAGAMQNVYFGMFMLLFIGLLMASRLPTISLKSLHISRACMLPTTAGLLLLVAFLATQFWLTLGVVGVLYIATIPFVGMMFLRTRSRYLREQGRAAAQQQAETAEAAKPAN